MIQYNNEPLHCNNVPIKVVSDLQSLNAAVNELLSYTPSYLGIDCEWKPQFVKGRKQNKISLLQIAHQRLIILVRLNKLHSVYDALLNCGLLHVLQNKKIIKCGVGILGDKKKMYQDHGVNIKRCLELNHLNLYPIRSNKPESYLSLKKLCEKVLKREMKYKSKKVTMSNWQKDILTKKQIMYAAEDAFVSYEICDKLLRSNGKIGSMECLLQNIDKYTDRKIYDDSLEYCRDKYQYIGKHCQRFALGSLSKIHFDLLGVNMKKKHRMRLKELVIYFDDIFDFDGSSQEVISKIHERYTQHV